MNKDFQAWSLAKASLDTQQAPKLLYKEREVWWMKTGFNVGSESNGSKDTYSRPVLIVKGFSATIFWGIPLSNTPNRGEYIVPVVVNGQERAALLSQMRVLDTRRIGSKISMITEEEMSTIKSVIVGFMTEEKFPSSIS